jgi:hypothetical protein
MRIFGQKQENQDSLKKSEKKQESKHAPRPVTRKNKINFNKELLTICFIDATSLKIDK